MSESNDNLSADESTNDKSKSFEMRAGLTIAIFAAILAITDLFAGKWGDDEIKATNEKASAFMWYQAKSIKETIIEGQRDLLKSLAESGALQTEKQAAVDKHIDALSTSLVRYKKEKQEILLGSASVGPENWVQEVNGEKGKVIGALEWEASVGQLGTAGDRFDYSTLFLQLCLVMGAISLVLQQKRAQILFYSLMLGLGILGTGFSIFGFMAMS